MVEETAVSDPGMSAPRAGCCLRFLSHRHRSAHIPALDVAYALAIGARVPRQRDPGGGAERGHVAADGVRLPGTLVAVYEVFLAVHRLVRCPPMRSRSRWPRSR